jgi:hypothetical protein
MAEKGISILAVVAVVIAIVAVAGTGALLFIKQSGPGGGFGENQAGEATGENVNWDGAQVLTDPEGDFWMGEGSPPQVIQFSASDITKIYIMNDNQYLYLKFEMGGTISTLPYTYQGDYVRMLAIDLIVDNDQDENTGNVMNTVGGELALETWLGSPQQAGGVFYKYVKYAFYDPAAEEGVGEWKYGTLVAGGPGENFVTMKFSLADLNLASGMRINVFAAVEAESDLYHHFARDVFPEDRQWYFNIEIR